MAVIETVKFNLKAGVDREEFYAINERFQREVAPVLPGLTRREASRAEDGTLLLILRYTDMDSAARAMGSDTSDVSQQLMSMIDTSSLQVGHYEIVSE